MKSYNDAPYSYQLGFQDPASPTAVVLQSFYHFAMMFFFATACGVFYFLLSTLFSGKKSFYVSGFTNDENLEFWWTLVPMIILGTMCVPSMCTMYAISEIIHPQVTMKAVANQWYWSYEYSGVNEKGVFSSYEYESHMVPTSSLSSGWEVSSLLSVDNPLMAPVNTALSMVVTSNDVIHSFACPSLAVKMDAIPGHLNNIGVIIQRLGKFTGQCSEMCGMSHAHMPIVMESVPMSDFLVWHKANMLNS